jgi:hypothetical protein
MVKTIRPASCCGGAARVGKSIVRNASKSMEKTMIKQAKSLFENPFKVLPEYTDKESKKRFKKVRKHLEKVNKVKEDVSKLEKLSKKMNLSGAVAGTMLIAHNEKAPFLAIAKLPMGSVHYAQRGQAPKEYLIAAQHTDDPFFRIFGIRDIALKYHLHIYSWDSGFVSTGSSPSPPKEFVDFVANTLEYQKEGNVVHCSHLSKETIINEKLVSQPYLHLYWKSADLHVGICEQCASQKKNSIFSLTKYVLADDITDDFDLDVIGSIIKDDPTESIGETDFIDDYFSGKLSDYLFIKKNMDQRREELQDKDQVVYILDGSHYNSRKDFIEALHPNSFEKKALEKLLSLHQKPIIVSDVSPNDVLSKYWEDYGFDIINDITNEEEITDEILSLTENPSVMIKTAFEIKKKQEVLNHLPHYKSLPDIASYADKLARIYRVQGKQKLFSTLRSPPEHPKKRAISYGLLMVINKHSDSKWKYSKIDIESGEFLKPYLSKLLEGNPEEYHETLQQVLTASGFSESLDEYKIS